MPRKGRSKFIKEIVRKYVDELPPGAQFTSADIYSMMKEKYRSFTFGGSRISQILKGFDDVVKIEKRKFLSPYAETKLIVWEKKGDPNG